MINVSQLAGEIRCFPGGHRAVSSSLLPPGSASHIPRLCASVGRDDVPWTWWKLPAIQDRLHRCGAPMQNLAHSASLHSWVKIVPSNPWRARQVKHDVCVFWLRPAPSRLEAETVRSLQLHRPTSVTPNALFLDQRDPPELNAGAARLMPSADDCGLTGSIGITDVTVLRMVPIRYLTNPLLLISID